MNFNNLSVFFQMYHEEIKEHDYMCVCNENDPQAILTCPGIRKGHENRCGCDGVWENCYQHPESPDRVLPVCNIVQRIPNTMDLPE
jgi:hypothetical protein